MVESKKFVKKKVVIAPFNQEAVFIYHQLSQQNIDVIAFFDSNKALHNKSYLNIPIFPYFYLDNVSVIMANMVTVPSRLIKEELKSVGYDSIIEQTDIIFDVPFHKIAEKVDIEAFVDIKGYKYGVPIKRKIASVEKRHKFNIKFISVDITNKCTLNCKYCCTLMPYQQHGTRKNLDLDITMKAIEKIVDCVDFIPELSIMGGEPFLNPSLKDLLLRLDNEKIKRKIGNILISTNGTIVPDLETLKAINSLKNHMYIYVSTYKKLSVKTYELLKICNQYDIACVTHSNKYWTPMCTPFNPATGGYQLIEAQENCSKCVFVKNNQPRIVEGKLYKCSFLSYGELGEIIPIDENNSLDLINEEFSNDKLQEYLDDFQPGRVYCSQHIAEVKNGGREGMQVPIAEQTVAMPEYAKHG